ncbi:hypothetical protein ABLT40_09875 [Acinetobacter schindleri]|uniref:hypothetical protein n=1 Tax=Acinetobacter schindleri TaxID=108981 RepID=UPI0032B326A4
MTWFAVAAAAAAVASTAITGYSSYQNNKAASEQAEADANAVKARGRVEAERIRKEKEKAQSRARAAAAENGLDVHEGTAVVINDQIELDGNYDANMAEITGYNASQRLKGEASMHKSNANTAAAVGALNTASVMGGFSSKSGGSNTSKSGASQTGGGWK